MTLPRGFNSQVQEPEANTGNPLFQGTSIFRVSHHQTNDKQGQPQNKKHVILLDDVPVTIYRHKLNTWNMGKGTPWQTKDVRITCADPTNNSRTGNPKACLMCEAMIRHGDIIKRTFSANLTVIDITGYFSERKGRRVTHTKAILELDFPGYKVFAEKKQHAPGGSIAPMMFSVMRAGGPPQNTKVYGDSWTPMGNALHPQQLKDYLKQCPAIAHLVEFAKGRGRVLTWDQAVDELAAAVDYDREMSNYSPELAELFNTFATAKEYTASASSNSGGGYQQAATMPASSVPNYAPQPFPPMGQQQQQPPVPMGQPAQMGQPAYPGQPQQPPTQPPQVANPQGATPPGFQPGVQPGFAPPTQQAAPQAAPQPGYAPQPSLAPPAQAAAPVPGAAPQQGVDGYAFDQQQGWSSQFPAGQQPVPQQQQQQPVPQQPAAAPQPFGQVPPAPPQMPF